MHSFLLFLTKWSPYIWLFGSVFGVIMSGTLFKRSYDQRVVWQGVKGQDRTVVKFWYRHAVWFLVMHIGFVVVGVITVADIKTDWANFLTLGILLSTPLVLVYRSYDALRLNIATERNGAMNGNG